MEAPAERAARLLAAIEDLAAQEAVTLRSRRFEEAIALQHRAAPLVEMFAAGAADVPDALRARVAALIERRRGTEAWLAQEIETARVTLRETVESRHRVARVAPAYGSGGVPLRRLSAMG